MFSGFPSANVYRQTIDSTTGPSGCVELRIRARTPVDVEVEGQGMVPMVIETTKQGWAYVFNRETGEPVWPIEEREVAQSTVPGEATAPTQPFPTRPAPFDRQGVTPEDLIDFTPEIRERAREQAASLVLVSSEHLHRAELQIGQK